MANITPQQLFPNAENKALGEAVTAESLVLPLSDLPAVSPAEADIAAGNGSEVLRGILEQSFSQVTALAPEAKPTKMTIAKSNPQGIGTNTMRTTFTVAFDLTIDPTLLAPVAE
ncbi:hypothetical protein [Spirulina sp. 06S082]|uniref:hypothetical protein n=1 Tax=Spirulina sp. 06S082 TaxID=3110248 RepID=UPI002B208F11|nr:hypothetical protein [Spirulina sp. 06S082]MEA5467990.1 hypothetical protein [Spirulina sp. 06S082]